MAECCVWASSALYCQHAGTRLCQKPASGRMHADCRGGRMWPAHLKQVLDHDRHHGGSDGRAVLQAAAMHSIM